MYPPIHKNRIFPGPLTGWTCFGKDIQHYHPVDFFGEEEAFSQRKELDQTKRQLCQENGVRLVEWPYSKEPSESNVEDVLPDDS